MKNFRFSIFIILITISNLLLSQQSRLNKDNSSSSFLTIIEDGSWCWFSDPRAVHLKNKYNRTYIGCVNSSGDIVISYYDLNSCKTESFSIQKAFQIDDHTNPSIIINKEGKLIVFFTHHNGSMFVVHAKFPENISEWETPVKIEKFGKFVCYSNPVILSGEKDRIYLFWRGSDWQPTVSWSDDGGKSWTDHKPVIKGRTLKENNRPYTKITSDGIKRIDFAFTNGHPRDEKQNSIYHMYYENGNFFTTNGEKICSLDEIPVDPSKVLKVYDGVKTGVRAWIWDIALDKKNNPVIVYTRLPDEKDHRYCYAQWSNGKWIDNEICRAGKWFPATAIGKTEPEPHYSGGIVLDHNNPSIVYLSKPEKDVFEIEKFTTKDKGISWKSTPVTANSSSHNIRPFVVRNYVKNGPHVLWMNIYGKYIHYTNYLTQIKSDIPLKDFSQVNVLIENKSNLDTENETVEVLWENISENLINARADQVVVFNKNTNEEIPSQIVYDDYKNAKSILFQVNCKAGEFAYYKIKEGKPLNYLTKTYGRKIPERKDDFAWENDCIAYRMYGPALEAGGEISNGVDVWVKKTKDLVINKWYKLNDYHHDNGEGLDFYTVGKSLGASGIAPFYNGKLYYSKNYISANVIENGPIRTTFELKYAPWVVNGLNISETKRISIDAGSYLNKFEIYYDFPQSDTLIAAAGIVKRLLPGNISIDEKEGTISYWEAENSINGTIGAGIVTHDTSFISFTITDNHLLALHKVIKNKSLVYYAGACWDKQGRFTTFSEWQKYLYDFSKRLNNKLILKIY